MLCIGLLVVVVRLLALIGSVPAAGAAAVPSISLSPATVAPGGTLTVDGSGFTYSSSSSSLVTISLNAPNPSNAGSHVGTSAVFVTGRQRREPCYLPVGHDLLPAERHGGCRCLVHHRCGRTATSADVHAAVHCRARRLQGDRVRRRQRHHGRRHLYRSAVAADQLAHCEQRRGDPAGRPVQRLLQRVRQLCRRPDHLRSHELRPGPAAFAATSTPPVAGAGDYGLGAGGALTAIPLQVVPPASLERQQLHARPAPACSRPAWPAQAAGTSTCACSLPRRAQTSSAPVCSSTRCTPSSPWSAALPSSRPCWRRPA